MNDEMNQPASESPTVVMTPEKNSAQAAVTPYMTPLSVLAAGIIIAMAVIYTRTPVPANTGQIPPKVDVKDVSADGGPFLGSADAPVTLAYWSDFQCPYCKEFELHLQPEIIKNYVNTGKVKIVFKDYQFLGPDSLTAALYARAIWDLYPDLYFTWREALYEKQDAENGGFGNEASVMAMTKTVPGIDVNKVTARAKAMSDTYNAAIAHDREEGAKMGINGTPGFITGDKLLAGARDYSVFPEVFDPQL